MTKRTVIIYPGDMVEILVIQDDDLPRTKAEFNWQSHGSRESFLIQHQDHRTIKYFDPMVHFEFSNRLAVKATPPAIATSKESCDE